MLIKIDLESKRLIVKAKDSSIPWLYVVTILIVVLYCIAWILSAALSGTDLIELMRYYNEH